MCAEVLSWREETWWERKSIPLGSHALSPRQVFLLATFGGLGDLISRPIPLAIFGIVYLGKLIPVFAMLGVGFVLSSQRVKMIPLEFELFFRATKNKGLRATANLGHFLDADKANHDEKAASRIQ
jgi:hypothetical protein